ncbi:MAG: class I SAM-dependent methyltransferase [Lachnospiraceae bacterium]|nr:class I SAM-dependent methyltransferase [Lachnospiraceae bacterium]
MNENSFDEKRIAEGYAKDRPYLHGQVIELLGKEQVTQHFQRGLDVGCGAGLSTKALKSICDKVTGTDISMEMVKAAQSIYDDSAYEFLQSRAEQIIAPADTFDIVTASGMINWVDRAAFLDALKVMMRAQGVLLIYDFWISDQMRGCDAYTDWYNREYLIQFPKPPRREEIWGDEDIAPYGFGMEKQITFQITCDFSLEAFIRFMMIQSNVNVQITEGKKTQEDIYRWFEETLAPVFGDREQTLVFQGYAWFLRKLL